MLLAIQLPSHLSTTTFLVATLNRANEAFVVHVIIFAQATQHSQHLKLYGWTIPRTAATIQVLVAGYTAQGTIQLRTGEPYSCSQVGRTAWKWQTARSYLLCPLHPGQASENHRSNYMLLMPLPSAKDHKKLQQESCTNAQILLPEIMLYRVYRCAIRTFWKGKGSSLLPSLAH